MILLTSTSDKLQIITGAAAQVDVHASWIDLTTGPTVTSGRTNTKISTATTTDVVASPAASTTRNIKTLKVGNNHATASCLVTIQHTDGANVIILEQVTLAPSERIGYEEGEGIRCFDALGREKVNSATLSANGNMNTADVVASAADTYLTGSNIALTNRLQVGSIIRWELQATKTAAGTAAATFNARFGTAGAVGDTSRNLMTLAAATAAADDGLFNIFAVFTAIGASAVFRTTLALDHLNAGFTTAGHFHLATVASSAFDVTPTGTQVGLSCNPGAAGVWTFQTVSVQGFNLLN